MREFVYFSSSAPTTGGFDRNNLIRAGRMDIAINVIIQGFFLSHDVRKDMKMHLIFYGMPDPPKHIEIMLGDEFSISKKDIAGMIKKILYKYKEGKKTEVFSKIFVEKKSFLDVTSELIKEGKEIFILDKNGEDIREIEIPKDCVFILGDHEGLPKKEIKRIKQIAKKISLGNRIYFASQAVVIVNNELDRRLI